MQSQTHEQPNPSPSTEGLVLSRWDACISAAVERTNMAWSYEGIWSWIFFIVHEEYAILLFP